MFASPCHPATVLPSPSRESRHHCCEQGHFTAKNWATSLPALSATRKRGKNARRMLQRLLVSKKCLDNAGTVREQKMFGECGDYQRGNRFRGHNGCGRKKLLRKKLLKGIGAELVKAACYDVIKACDDNNQENFGRSLTLLRKEFSSTKKKLTSFAQMEQRIIRLEKSQSPASTSQSPK
ncbi:uncharacterized protein LOC114186303 [Vigna unguiculata]|uniref:uncharacterized protein LOC114186303 n=1 Tax=Vigna unguiculata TaxID=3917 RepID=UPI0010168E78|nr:uncharacterized protein LOC114186303 [Vigna unguiculata]